MDVFREVDVFFITREDDAVWLFFAGDEFKGAKVGIGRDAEVSCCTAVDIEIPHQAELSSLAESGGEVATVRALPDPPFLIADGDNFCVPNQIFVRHRASFPVKSGRV